MKEHLIFWLLFNIFVYVAISFVLYSIEFKKMILNRILFIGIIQAGCSWLLKILLKSLFTQLLISLSLLTILLHYFAEIDIHKSYIYTSLALIYKLSLNYMVLNVLKDTNRYVLSGFIIFIFSIICLVSAIIINYRKNKKGINYSFKEEYTV